MLESDGQESEAGKRKIVGLVVLLGVLLCHAVECYLLWIAVFDGYADLLLADFRLYFLAFSDKQVNLP